MRRRCAMCAYCANPTGVTPPLLVKQQHTVRGHLPPAAVTAAQVPRAVPAVTAVGLAHAPAGRAHTMSLVKAACVPVCVQTSVVGVPTYGALHVAALDLGVGGGGLNGVWNRSTDHWGGVVEYHRE